MSRHQKRTKKRKLNEEDSKDVVHAVHRFVGEEIITFRENILKWFSLNKRDLPWRSLAIKGTLKERVYAVLVSEIMLQQTQVATVKSYYNKWMARWPTAEDLAIASYEDVSEMWSGLGYYSRGRRLLEAAQEISKNDFKLPCSSVELQKCLPGVGRYTASAVASIVFAEKVAAVDGNVVRVMSRLRIIGSDSSSPVVVNGIWDIADQLVDPEQPGNFNEAMMELGAVICTPKAPKCSECPLKQVCLAYKTVKMHGNNHFNLRPDQNVPDIENLPGCKLCLPTNEEYDTVLGVMNYPRKSKKASPKNLQSVVWILHRHSSTMEVEYFIVKRPVKGLLANLWEFPCYVIPNDVDENKHQDFAKEKLKTHHGIDLEDMESVNFVGNVPHMFTHINQLYIVFEGKLKSGKLPKTSDGYVDQQWIDCNRFNDAAASTAMRKVFDRVASKSSDKAKQCKEKKDAVNKKTPSKNSSITDFFSKKSNLKK